MANEALLSRLYDIIDEVTRLGGEQERTAIVPGILVADADPNDLPTGYIKIVNPRDGTYVPCLTVNGLVVSDNDLVNVLFAKGTEPVALNQSATSPSSGIKVYQLWESDFGAVAWSTDADGNLTGTANLIIPLDLIHSGDVDTKITFTDDQVDLAAGAITMIRLDEDAQDVLSLGDVDGGGDVDVNINNGQVFVQGSDGKVGIGPVAIPHGGSGYALLELRGDNASADGPHIQLKTTADIYALFQILGWTHDNIAINFDAYYDGSWRSSDVGSNAQIYKNSDLLRLRYDNGIAQGSAITWVTGLELDLSDGLITNVTATESPVYDLSLLDSANDSGITSHWRDNDSGYPAGWTETDAAWDTNTDDIYSFWSIISHPTDTSFDYSIQGSWDVENDAAANAFNSWIFGPILYRPDTAWSGDTDLYVGIYADSAGIDTTTWVRAHLQFNNAGGIWRIRGEDMDGSTETDGSWFTVPFPYTQPIYFRIVLRNDTNKNGRIYIGTGGLARDPLAQFRIQAHDVGSGVTWGSVFARIHGSQPAGGANATWRFGALDFISSNTIG
jgi:hypothetical protein